MKLIELLYEMKAELWKHSDISNFEQVTNSSSFLEFPNLVENIAVTIKNFGDGAETLQKSNLKNLVNKLPDYLRIQWVE
jgi:hypothetical protein